MVSQPIHLKADKEEIVKETGQINALFSNITKRDPLYLSPYLIGPIAAVVLYWLHEF